MGIADKLKPCPICGSEVNLIEEDVGEYTVVCHGCQVLMIADDVSSKNEAIERWNNRVNEPKWIPIEEQEPPKEDWYLVGLPENNEEQITRTVDICWWNGNNFSRDETGEWGIRKYYTHWSYLPKPPKS